MFFASFIGIKVKSRTRTLCKNNQYDGGGHEIGEHLAKELNIPLYDRTIIDQTARELEYSAEYIKRKEQSTSNMELLKMIFADSSGMLPEMK